MNIQLPGMANVEGKYRVVTSVIKVGDLVSLFEADNEYKHASERTQRIIAPSRCRAIRDYVTNNEDWVMPSFMASIDDAATFTTLDDSEVFGTLSIPLTSERSLWDGQHRKGGFALIVSDDELAKYKEYSVTIKFYIGLNVAQLQQAFSDVNQKAVKGTSALGLTFNHRDPLPLFIKGILENSLPDVRLKVDFEAITPNGKSICLWSIKGFESAVKNIIGMSEKEFNKLEAPAVAKLHELVVGVFTRLHNLPYWTSAITDAVSAHHIRQSTLIGQVVFLEALSIWFKCVTLQWIENSKKDWTPFDKLKDVTVERHSPIWVGRCVNFNGTMNKTKFGIYTTVAKLCELTGVAMTQELYDANQLLINQLKD